MKKTKIGFTIVELLIVIVVIAILAAISVVAYTGIQNRANDSAVQADIRNFANLILQYQVINGTYPPGNYNYGVPAVGNFKVSRSSYAATFGIGNFFYCEGDIAGSPQFAVIAKSKSGTNYIYRSNGGAGVYTAGSLGGYPSLCPALGMSAYTPGYGFFQGAEDGGWYSWTK